jgi:HEPN domain-containing protein
MATRDQLKALAKTRLKEAEALFAAGLYDGAAYLSGYVVELALKARICRILAIRDYPDTGKYKQVYATHDFDQLLFLAGLRSKMQPNSSLFLKWSIASPWTPERRYSPVGTFTNQDAEDVLNAIRDPTDGILRWIKKHW